MNANNTVPAAVESRAEVLFHSSFSLVSGLRDPREVRAGAA